MQVGLTCIGLTTLDIVAWPIDSLPPGDNVALVKGVEMQPAGTAAATALIAATLGMKSSVISAVGADSMGKFIRSALAERGVDVEMLVTLADRPSSTTLLAVSAQDERPKFHLLGASTFMGIDAAAIRKARSSKFVHWAAVGAPTVAGGAGAQLLEAARRDGAIVTCDLISPRASALAELRLLMPHIDYFMPSVAEAFSLASTSDPQAAARFFLDLGARAVIIKMGADGSHVALGGEHRRVPAHEIAVMDTTSCGDSFCAGFICALDRGREVLDAVRFATATAALVAQGLGTLGKLVDFDTTERAMRTMPLRH